MQFTDRMALDSGLRKTDDGWVAQAKVARGGNVQLYLGDEVGAPDMDFVRVYRPETEVFDRKAFQTYARKPITIGHPAGGVSPETWKDLAVGEIDRDVVRDGEFVSVPLLFRDARAIEAMTAGARELSMGYDAEIRLEDGTTPSGEPYDAVMSGFRMNHVAVVQLARGGAELRIGDGAGKWGAMPITDADKEVSMTLRKIMVDGLEVETTDAGAAAIKKLTDEKAAAVQALTDAKADHDKAIAAKDAEIAKAEAERDEAKGKIMSDADLDARVQARSGLISSAKAIVSDVDTTGKSDAEIRRAVVVAKLGDEAVKDRSEAYIDARFDILAEDAGKAKADPVRSGLATARPVSGDPKAIADAAWAKAVSVRANAWAGETKQ